MTSTAQPSVSRVQVSRLKGLVALAALGSFCSVLKMCVIILIFFFETEPQCFQSDHGTQGLDSVLGLDVRTTLVLMFVPK